MKRIRLFVILLAVFLLFNSLFCVYAEAQVPVQNYTYWENMSAKDSRKPVFAKELFTVAEILSAADFGVENFAELTDVFVSDDTVYLLDGGSSRLVLLDRNYNFKSQTDHFILGGKNVSFKNAKGIFVRDGLIYVCDTENGRILIADSKFKVISTITSPESPLIPENFSFLPIKIGVDSQGYIYVLSEGSFYGLLLFTSEHEFVQFFAANDVTLGIGQTIDKIIERVFPNNKKKSASAKVLPFSIVDFCIDSDDFIYTATGATGTGKDSGQVKKLYHGNGKNILETSDKNYVDEGTNTDTEYGKVLGQNITSIDVDDSGFVYCLDTAFCRAFVYDEKGTLLSVFGGGVGVGEQKGTFKSVSSLAVNGSDVLVLDNLKNSITVFSPTDLCKTIKQARNLSLKGKYSDAKVMWQKVLKSDRNCQIAYSGLARAYYAEKDFNKSAEFAKLGYDRDTYALAFKEIRSSFLEKNFYLLFTGFLLIVAAVSVAAVILKKKDIVLVKNDKARLMCSSLFSPINTFTTIKEKQKGSLLLSAILVLLFYIFTVLKEISGGFLFVYYDAEAFNSVLVFIKSVGLVVLWVISNWLVCSLAGGIGKIKEIIVVVCYSLIPLIINAVLQLILTNILLPDEGAFLSILNTIAYLLFFMMIICGSMIIHDYSLKKFIVTGLLSLLGMAIVIFLLILIFILFQQFAGFIQTIFTELVI